MRKIYNKFLNILILMTINKNAGKAKPRVIVGRLLGIIGGRPLFQRWKRRGKPRVPGHWDSWVAEVTPLLGTGLSWHFIMGNPVFNFNEKFSESSSGRMK